MMRRGQRTTANVIAHVWNRGARKLRIFRDSVDYTEFINTLRQAQQRENMRILSYIVMPTHFHLVVWPRTAEHVAGFMRWLTTTHAKRWHARHQASGTGSVYQGRYSATSITSERHFLDVCRYVEANAFEGLLVERAEDWRGRAWGSVAEISTRSRWNRGRICNPEIGYRV
jgi:putative transposase